MSEQKTHAEIIAEMRFHGQQNIDAEKDKPEYGILTVEGRITQNYAAELDAAHKREVEDAERRGNHAATKAICDTLEKVGPLYDADSIGNAAKLREALVLALSLLDLKEGVPYKTVSQKDIDFMKAALAAPARNCDIGTAEEQYQRMVSEYCHRFFYAGDDDQYPCKNCPLHMRFHRGVTCPFTWAQMPYDESEVAK